MLLLGVVAGLLLGLAVGGRLENLLNVRLRWTVVIVGALVLRFAAQTAVANQVGLADTLRLPLFGLSFGLLAAALWANRAHAGLLVAAVGVGSNTLAVIVNGGWMPVWAPALDVVGLGGRDLQVGFHRVLPAPLDLEFLLRGGPIGDIIPFPVPFFPNVGSIGDVFLSLGLGWFVFSTLVRGPAIAHDVLVGAPARSDQTIDVVGFDRPIVLGGGRGPGRPSGAQGREPARPETRPARPETRPARPTLPQRFRAHPYTRLALDARFSAFWIGQTLSLFGDRLHQVALGVLVYGVTGSPLATGLVFLAATIPNLLLGPVAGTFVDRWDHKKVMVVSDVLRGALVMTIPFAVDRSVVLIYPIVFLVTTVSIFFRPAKAAVVPRIVEPDDLLAANSATWTGETLADIVGYPLAGVFAAFLGAALPIAFFADAATYFISAALLVAIAIPAVVRAADQLGVNAFRRFGRELMDGWRYLRGHPALYQNTLISAVAQTSIGATIALTVVYARDWLDPALIPYPQNYAAIETAIGVGNLVGGFAVGAIGARLRKGPLIVGGMIAMGAGTVVLGLTTNALVALTGAIIVGVANLIYIIPTQTLFGEVVPMQLMGRVVALRSSLVFGAMTGAMAVSGVLAESFGAGLVIAGFGTVTVLAGLLAAALPAVRDPEGVVEHAATRDSPAEP